MLIMVTYRSLIGFTDIRLGFLTLEVLKNFVRAEDKLR